MTAQLLFPLLLVALLVPMFLGVRRQKREAEKVNSVQQGIKVGDRVTTTSGLYGTVVDVDETSIDLEIAEDVVTTWLRAAIRDVRTDDVSASDSAAIDSPAEDVPAAIVEVEPVALEQPVNGSAADTADGPVASNGSIGNGSASHDTVGSSDAADDASRLRKD